MPNGPDSMKPLCNMAWLSAVPVSVKRIGMLVNTAFAL
jgi:hypothetical protein